LASADFTRSSNTSASATTFSGPAVVASALTTAPPPRPPQPISARRMVLSSAANTCGTFTPASAEAAMTAEVVLRNERRPMPAGVATGQFGDSFMCPGPRGR